MPTACTTQNLDFLIDAMEKDSSESESDEWEEMCNYLTQKQEAKQNNTGNTKNLIIWYFSKQTSI